eukprot:GHVQ01015790.1.p1 GENE.GHVQ01015790.1~~GHVQ01015790.1.p1  ORF type:complete len:867 (-),score=123.80 GHVQ01015790.1:1133-3733(-)
MFLSGSSPRTLEEFVDRVMLKASAPHRRLEEERREVMLAVLRRVGVSSVGVAVDVFSQGRVTKLGDTIEFIETREKMIAQQQLMTQRGDNGTLRTAAEGRRGSGVGDRRGCMEIGTATQKQAPRDEEMEKQKEPHPVKKRRRLAALELGLGGHGAVWRNGEWEEVGLEEKRGEAGKEEVGEADVLARVREAVYNRTNREKVDLFDEMWELTLIEKQRIYLLAKSLRKRLFEQNPVVIRESQQLSSSNINIDYSDNNSKTNNSHDNIPHPSPLSPPSQGRQIDSPVATSRHCPADVDDPGGGELVGDAAIFAVTGVGLSRLQCEVLAAELKNVSKRRLTYVKQRLEEMLSLVDPNSQATEDDPCMETRRLAVGGGEGGNGDCWGGSVVGRGESGGHVSLARAQTCLSDVERFFHNRRCEWRKGARADKDSQRVQCCIHKSLVFPRWIFENVIDSAPFQRLRDLHQLGACRFVFPSATHTRFDHSLGVAHLGGLQFQHLCNKLRFSLNDREVRLLHDYIVIAGLAHDIGHGPYSHTFETFFVNPIRAEKQQGKWHHEDMSLLLVDEIAASCTQEEVQDVLDETGLKIIKRMIRGVRPEVGPIGTDAFESLQRACYDIISNKRNGLDVDRFDYMQRDFKMLSGDVPSGNSSGFTRLMEYTGVIDGELVYNDKVAPHVYNVYHSRASLFRSSYTHKKVRAMELMLCDAFRIADPIFGYSDAVDDPARFLELTDHGLLHDIRNLRPWKYEGRGREDVERAQDLVKYVTRERQTSKMYRYACGTTTTSERIKDENPASKVADELTRLCSPRSILPSDIIVDWNEVQYGTGSKNPFDCVRFYTAHNETESYRISAASSSKRRWLFRPLRVLCG